MPTPLSYWFHARGVPGFKKTITQQGPTDGATVNYNGVIPAMSLVDSDGVSIGDAAGGIPTSQPTLPAGTDRSGTTSATAGAATVLAPANAARKGLTLQNISTGNIGINEIGGTAAIGSAGTYTVPAGGTFRASTNRALSIVGSAASLAYTATEF